MGQTRAVLIEINPPALHRAGSSGEAVIDALRAAGFARIERVRERGLRSLQHSEVLNVLATH